MECAQLWLLLTIVYSPAILCQNPIVQYCIDLIISECVKQANKRIDWKAIGLLSIGAKRVSKCECPRVKVQYVDVEKGGSIPSNLACVLQVGAF